MTTPALERLASMIEEGLTADEEQILSWVARWVPQSDIAEWLGITHGALRNRVMRLRARLKEVAMQYAATFTGTERAELSDFFRRAFITSRYTEPQRFTELTVSDSLGLSELGGRTNASRKVTGRTEDLITEDGVDFLMELAGSNAFANMDPLDPQHGPFLDWLARDARMRQAVSDRSETETRAHQFAERILQRVASERAERPA